MVSEVTSTTTSGAKPAEEEEWEKEEEHICQWSRCKQSTVHFETIEALLEHVNEKHIPTRQKSKEDGLEAVVCKWADCQMSTTRGDLKKKTEWMKCHFKTRHARSAKLFKCLFDGCDTLKATSQELEIHVRRYHSMKPKREKKPSPSPEPEPTNQIFEIHGLGRVSWKPAPIVTKPTIVEYSDGPRYVFPDGYVKADLDSDGKPLADDEYWAQVHYFDYHQLPMVPSTSKYQYNMPRGAFKRAEPNRPTRIRRKMTEEMIKARDARRRKEAGLPPIDAVRIRMPWREEKKKNELERSSIPCKHLEKEISPPPDFIEESKVVEDIDIAISDIDEMPKLKAHYEEDSEVETLPKKVEPRTPQSSVSPRKSSRQNSEATPQKTGSQTRKLVPTMEDSESATATSTDSESDSTAVTTPRKRLKILTKRVSRSVFKKNDSEDSDSESEGVTPPPEIEEVVKTPQKAPETKNRIQTPKTPQKRAQTPQKTAKTPQPSKRPARTCKSNLSCLSEQDAELVWKVILESPMKENLNATHEVKNSESPKKIQKVPESRRTSPRKSEMKNLKRQIDFSPRKASPYKKRPSRACRALGSMEEVPFDVEIQLEV